MFRMVFCSLYDLQHRQEIYRDQGIADLLGVEWYIMERRYGDTIPLDIHSVL